MYTTTRKLSQRRRTRPANIRYSVNIFVGLKEQYGSGNTRDLADRLIKKKDQFKGSLPEILLGPFLNILTHLFMVSIGSKDAR